MKEKKKRGKINNTSGAKSVKLNFSFERIVIRYNIDIYR